MEEVDLDTASAQEMKSGIGEGSEDALYMEMDDETHDEYKESFSDFMTEIQDHVKKLAGESSRAPKDAYEAFQAFSAAVDWSESWIRGLLAFHVILFLIVCVTRKNVTIQSCLFLYVCFLVLLAEHLNSFCAQNWQSFATQNYFDAHGSFAAVVYAGPLLLIALLQMINFLILASSALIKAKRLELQANKNKRETKKRK